jgi:predicted hydrocarbon binding protein
MYQMNKRSKEVKIACTVCKKDVIFTVPSDLLANKVSFPYPFRYIHGDPIHSITIYLDKDFNIRGHEIGDSISLSSEIINRITKGLCVDKNAETSVFLRTMINALNSVLNMFTSDGGAVLFQVGKILGQTYESFFKGDNEIALLEDLSIFWQENKFGTMTDFEKVNENLLFFDVYDCFECSHLPNLGKTVCKMDEGFIKSMLEKRFKKNYDVQEIECYARGDMRCRFQVKM